MCILKILISLHNNYTTIIKNFSNSNVTTCKYACCQTLPRCEGAGPQTTLHLNVQFLSLSLTLRGLSLFFKILPISNIGDSIAYILATIHFLCPKLGSFSNMEYYFYQLAYGQESKVLKRFV